MRFEVGDGEDDCHAFTVGSPTLWYHGTYGIADIVVYGKDVIPHNLLKKEIKNYPDSGELTKLFTPYAFRSQCSAANVDEQLEPDSDVYFDGGSKYHTFSANGAVHDSGFVLQSSVSLSVDDVPMGALIFTGLAILMGGSAYRKGYSVFNIESQYKTLKFKVAAMDGVKADQVLEVVVEDEIVLTTTLDADGGEKEYEIDLNNCKRFGFMLGGSDTEGAEWNGKYAFYDLELSR